MKTEIVVIAAVAIAIYNNNATVKQGQCECNKYIGLIYRAETYADRVCPWCCPWWVTCSIRYNNHTNVRKKICTALNIRKRRDRHTDIRIDTKALLYAFRYGRGHTTKASQSKRHSSYRIDAPERRLGWGDDWTMKLVVVSNEDGLIATQASHSCRVARADHAITRTIHLRHTLGQMLLLLLLLRLLRRESCRLRNDRETADVLRVVVRHLERHIRSLHNCVISYGM